MKSTFFENEGRADAPKPPPGAVKGQCDSHRCFKFRQYQREDLARAAMHDGAILAWDPGLGKTAAAFTWPQLKGARHVLIVAPGGLHEQICKEGIEKFKIDIRPLMSQADFYRDDILRSIACAPFNTNAPQLETSAAQQPQPAEPPRFWLTTYQALGYNSADEFGPRFNQDGEEIINNQRAQARFAHQGFRDALRANVRIVTETVTIERGATPEILARIDKLKRLAADPAAFPGEIDNALNFVAELRAKFGIRTVTETIQREAAATNPRQWFDGIGGTLNGITCLFTPTLARLCADIFDCVVIDEGVRLKATESYISQGVRALRPKYRLVLTGTPIKNVLIDLFWLAHWVCGGNEQATARWPYENADAARERFADEHMLMERNVTKEEETKARTGKRVRYVKRTPELCNVHRLWKLLGPVIVRRRKDECGEDLPPKTIVPIRVRPGTLQQKVYQRYLEFRPIMAKGAKRTSVSPQSGDDECNVTLLHPGAAIGMQIQLLRQAALCPHSHKLSEAILAQEADRFPRRSTTDLNPKSAAILSLVSDLLVKGEQVCIISPFQDFNHALVSRLHEAGVSAVLADGTISPAKRGKLADAFKSRKYSVLVGSTDAMSEGHSFECCSHLILPSLTWAMDKNAQAIERVHRLNSTRPVTIYAMVCENTIDVKLESNFNEKRDSSNLALDGRLFAERTQEINLAQLLRDAVNDFNPSAKTIDEEQMKTEWDLRLREKLRHAEYCFRGESRMDAGAMPGQAAETAREGSGRARGKRASQDTLLTLEQFNQLNVSGDAARTNEAAAKLVLLPPPAMPARSTSTVPATKPKRFTPSPDTVRTNHAVTLAKADRPEIPTFTPPASLYRDDLFVESAQLALL